MLVVDIARTFGNLGSTIERQCDASGGIVRRASGDRAHRRRISDARTRHRPRSAAGV
jgi:hypothetical protein